MYKKAETFPILLSFFQALSTLGHLFLPRQRIERIWGAKAEKRQRQEELRSQREFLTSLCLRRSCMFTHTHVAPLTAPSPAGNQHQGTKHPTAGTQNTGLVADESAVRGEGAITDVLRELCNMAISSP